MPCNGVEKRRVPHFQDRPSPRSIGQCLRRRVDHPSLDHRLGQALQQPEVSNAENGKRPSGIGQGLRRKLANNVSSSSNQWLHQTLVLIHHRRDSPQQVGHILWAGIVPASSGDGVEELIRTFKLGFGKCPSHASTGLCLKFASLLEVDHQEPLQKPLALTEQLCIGPSQVRNIL